MSDAQRASLTSQVRNDRESRFPLARFSGCGSRNKRKFELLCSARNFVRKFLETPRLARDKHKPCIPSFFNQKSVANFIKESSHKQTRTAVDFRFVPANTEILMDENLECTTHYCNNSQQIISGPRTSSSCTGASGCLATCNFSVPCVTSPLTRLCVGSQIIIFLSCGKPVLA